jgi:hypothetical protein
MATIVRLRDRWTYPTTANVALICTMPRWLAEIFAVRPVAANLKGCHEMARHLSNHGASDEDIVIVARQPVVECLLHFTFETTSLNQSNAKIWSRK